MSIFKCKMCGGDLDVAENQNIVECEYCGSKQTVPNGDNEKKINLFNRANRLRIACEFDKAAGIYENIISEFPEEAEAYWCLCLCNYGIEYVDDPLTANKIPTCHRASFRKLRKDENYESALEYADMDARMVYEEQAKEIDRIMGEILALSKEEKPYDIFICYKESDNSGARTPDSVLAQDIYDNLTQKGYRVFFSRITLEDKLGVHYEPYIFSALNSAKMMLVVGTDYEYMNAVWVRNEWSRFLRLMAEDKSKVLIPCYQNMDPYDMPDQFSGLQSQDCSKLGFMQDLTRGIDKIFGKGEQKSEEPKVVVQQAANGTTADSLLARMFVFLEDGKWDSAVEYANKVLDMDVKNVQAYIGLLMSDFKVNQKEELAGLFETFDSNDNYKKIVRFGDEAVCSEINSYNDVIKNRLCNEAEMKRELEEKERKDRENLIDNIAYALMQSNIDLLQKKYNRLEAEKDSLTALTSSFDTVYSEYLQLKNNLSQEENKRNELNTKKSSLGIFAVKDKKSIDDEISAVDKEIKTLNSKIEENQFKLKGFTSVSDIQTEVDKTQKLLDETVDKLNFVKFHKSNLSLQEANEKLKNPSIKYELLV